MTSESEKAVAAVIARMNKKFGGDHVIGYLKDKPIACEVIPTGSLALDLSFGVGGVPRQRITEIFGAPGTGKTTVIQHITAECQKLGGKAAIIDMEHKLDPGYAQACGVDMDSCIFSQPPSGEAALEIANSLIPIVDLVIVDSVCDLVTAAEQNSDVGDQHFAKLARLMSQEIKKMKPALGMSNCALVFVNQIRTGISSSGRSYHTNPGGLALQFAASIIGKIRKTGDLPNNGGITSMIKIAKNCVATPFKEVELTIRHGVGIDQAADIAEAAISVDAIVRAGAWYNFGEAKWQGKLAVATAIREDPKLAKAIRTAALEKVQ